MNYIILDLEWDSAYFTKEKKCPRRIPGPETEVQAVYPGA